MTITEKSTIDQITVDATGNVSVRRCDQVLRGGEVIASTFHRHVLAPGDDLTGQDPRVAAVAAAVWTPESIAVRTAEVIAQARSETATRKAALAEEADKQAQAAAAIEEAMAQERARIEQLQKEVQEAAERTEQDRQRISAALAADNERLAAAIASHNARVQAYNAAVEAELARAQQTATPAS
jgi:hypothetical protein